MKNTNRLLKLIGLGVLLLGFFWGYVVLAESEEDIQYPVAELGNCENEQECRTYCDSLSNIQECVAFAEVHDLLSAEELAEARLFAELGIESGPGGCTSEDACEAYCENVANINECLAFAEQVGFFSEQELTEARQVAQALASGVHLPGGCQGKDECEVYCEDPANIDECIDFALAAGFIPPEEADIARRVAPLMARGEMPGGCRSQDECEAYCSQEENIEECVQIFESVGIVSAEEAELFRKTGGRGPGDCVGQVECDTFCNDIENQEICFEFAREHDLIPEDELLHIEEGIARFREGVQAAPPEVAQCLRDAIGEEVLEKIEVGEFLPNQEIGEQMQRCFEELFSRGGGEFGGEHDGEFQGGAPSGLTPKEEECIRRIIGVGFPTPEQDRQIGVECFAPEDFFPEEFDNFNEFISPDGKFPEEFGEEFLEEFNQREREEFQGEFDQQYQEEFPRQLEQQIPESFIPPEDFTREGDYPGLIDPIAPPPTSEEPSFEEPLPEAGLSGSNFLGAVWEAMEPGLKRIIPFL